MINQTAERIWAAGLLMLSLGYLIDRLLDRIEKLRAVIMPAQACELSRHKIRVEMTRLDQFGA
jgi:hypothetical protein